MQARAGFCLSTHSLLNSSQGHKSLSGRMRIALAVMMLCLGLMPGFQARAETAPATAQPASGSKIDASTPHLTEAQAQQLLGVLDNDSKREQFVTTLRNLSAAQGAAPTATASGQTTQPIRANSLGGQLLGSFSNLGNTSLREVHVLTRTVGNFRSLAPWIRHVSNTPELRNEMLKVLLRVAVMIAVASALAFLVRLLLRKPRARLEGYARQRNLREQILEQEDAKDAKEAAERATGQEASTDSGATVSEQVEMQQRALATPITDPYQGEDGAERLVKAETEQNERLKHQGALAKLLMALRRLPFSIGCFLLDLLPVAMFPLVAFIMQSFDPDGDAQTADALQNVAWIANVTIGVWVAFLYATLAPGKPWLRLTTFSNDVSRFLFGWLRRIGFVLSWGIATLAVLDDCSMPDNITTALGKILALVGHVMLAIMIIRSRGYVSRAFEPLMKQGRLAVVVKLFVGIWWIVALFFDLSLWLVWAAEIHGGYARITYIFVRSCIALIIMRIISIAAYGALERFFRLVAEWKFLANDSQDRIARYYPSARRVLGVLVALLTLGALCVAWGVPLESIFGKGALGSRLLSSVSTIVIALLIGVLIWEGVNIAIERHIRNLGNYDDSKARMARFRTLQPMLRIILMVVLVGVVGLTVLSQIGVNTTPLLASASIFGVALGFGSQKLVQDFISGIFLLMENALTVGDAVTLSGTYGVVEKLSLRTVHVRANDGSMNIFPFSSLNQITNYNRDFARAIIVAEVGYSVDTDDVVKALNDITAEMRADEKFRDLIIDNFQMWGVDSLNDSSVTVRGTLPTTTAGRWPVQREFYRRMKKCFQARDIDIPFPTRTLEISGIERLMDYQAPKTRAEWIGKEPEDAVESGDPKAQGESGDGGIAAPSDQ